MWAWSPLALTRIAGARPALPAMPTVVAKRRVPVDNSRRLPQHEPRLAAACGSLMVLSGWKVPPPSSLAKSCAPPVPPPPADTKALAMSRPLDAPACWRRITRRYIA